MEGIISRFSQIRNGKRTREKVVQNVHGDCRREELIRSIQEISEAMEAVRSRFDIETDFDLIDACILELDSLEKRYCYLVKEAKREHLTAF